MICPQIDLQTRALTYYLQDHLSSPSDVPNISGGVCECVSEWRTSGKPCSMFDLAISSLALAVFAKTQQHPLAATEASSGYNRLLRVAQNRIRQLTTPTSNVQDIDECLLAVSLMCRFEGVIFYPSDLYSTTSFRSLPSWSHHDGAMAILKVWYDNLRHNTANSIVKQTRRGLIKSCLLRNIPLPKWLLDGSHFGEVGLELEYDRFLVRLSNLHFMSARLHQIIPIQTATVEDLCDEARELENMSQRWAALIPNEYSHQQYVLTEPENWPRKHFYSPIVYNYSSLAYAAMWTQYFAARMLLSSIRLRILRSRVPNAPLDLTHNQRLPESSNQLETMANNLASTIPFCLNRFKVERSFSPISRRTIKLNTEMRVKPYLATLVVWPLTIASSLDEIDSEQRKWFRSELAQLGTITGDGALEYAASDQWQKL